MAEDVQQGESDFHLSPGFIAVKKENLGKDLSMSLIADRATLAAKGMLT